MPWFKGAEYVI